MKIKLPTFVVCMLGMVMLSTSVGMASEKMQRTERTIDHAVYPEVTYGPTLERPLTTLNESFEGTTFPPANWRKFNPDLGPGWNRQVNGTTPVPGWQGGVITVPPGGGNAVAFNTWSTGGASSNDQWLVTPQISNVGSNDSLYFYMRWWPNNFADTVEVRIDTFATTPSVANFNILVVSKGFGANTTADTGWIQYRYRLSDFVAPGKNIYIAFREKVTDNINDGASISLDLVQVTVVTGVAEQLSDIPASFKLEQNYPNPFNPATTINFSIPDAGRLSLKIYTTLGQEVATLVEGQYSPGTYSTRWDASGLPSGMYFYRLQVGNLSQVKKLILMK